MYSALSHSDMFLLHTGFELGMRKLRRNFQRMQGGMLIGRPPADMSPGCTRCSIVIRKLRNVPRENPGMSICPIAHLRNQATLPDWMGMGQKGLGRRLRLHLRQCVYQGRSKLHRRHGPDRRIPSRRLH